ncbi:hypothetical protein F5Y15DRAFT_415514 [Xylariaceae sp. FL0016]|nr:hypothetical protein F5Y15DRAFT_415514 [Xylariaceae sp. FL0016]
MFKFPNVRKRQKLEVEAAAATGSGFESGSTAAVKNSVVALPDVSPLSSMPKKTTTSGEMTTATYSARTYMRSSISQRFKSINPQQLSRIRTGAKGSVFYAAYVYFEKVRILQGKPKTEFREEVEELWVNGFDLTMNNNTSVMVSAAEGPVYYNEFGLTNTSPNNFY